LGIDFTVYTSQCFSPLTSRSRLRRARGLGHGQHEVLLMGHTSQCGWWHVYALHPEGAACAWTWEALCAAHGWCDVAFAPEARAWSGPWAARGAADGTHFTVWEARVRVAPGGCRVCVDMGGTMCGPWVVCADGIRGFVRGWDPRVHARMDPRLTARMGSAGPPGSAALPAQSPSRVAGWLPCSDQRRPEAPPLVGAVSDQRRPEAPPPVCHSEIQDRACPCTDQFL
jgi:hypothetical protein